MTNQNGSEIGNQQCLVANWVSASAKICCSTRWHVPIDDERWQQYASVAL